MGVFFLASVHVALLPWLTLPSHSPVNATTRPAFCHLKSPRPHLRTSVRNLRIALLDGLLRFRQVYYPVCVLSTALAKTVYLLHFLLPCSARNKSMARKISQKAWQVNHHTRNAADYRQATKYFSRHLDGGSALTLNNAKQAGSISAHSNDFTKIKIART